MSLGRLRALRSLIPRESLWIRGSISSGVEVGRRQPADDPKGAFDRRRPRPAARCRLHHGRRSPAWAIEERQAKRHRRGGRHAVCRTGDLVIPSDRRFLAVTSKHLRHLFPKLPAQPGYFKRRRRLTETLEWLIDPRIPRARGSTTILCSLTALGGVRQKPRDRQALSSWAPQRITAIAAAIHGSSGAFACTRSLPPTAHPERSRWPRPNAMSVTSRWSSWPALAAQAAETIGDKGYAGRAFAQAVSELGATILRPRRKDEPGRGPAPEAPIRQRRQSSGAARGPSPWSAMALERSPGSESASCSGCSPLRRCDIV